MTIRALWIISLTPGNLGKVLYSRKFPTVEKRAEISHGAEYVSLPSDENLSMAVLFTLGLVEESKQQPLYHPRVPFRGRKQNNSRLFSFCFLLPMCLKMKNDQDYLIHMTENSSMPYCSSKKTYLVLSLVCTLDLVLCDTCVVFSKVCMNNQTHISLYFDFVILFVDWRDKASCVMKLPAVSIKVGKRNIWPVLIIEQVSSLLCCLPFEEKVGNALLNNTSVSIGFAVLIGILNFIGPSSTIKSKISQKFLELDNYITLSMPFGTPSDTDPLAVIDFYKTTSALLNKKKKSGIQVTKKMKSSVSLEINEFVRSAQCDQQNTELPVDVYGSVIASVDSSSNINDVSVTLEHSDASKSLYLKSLIIHPCVQTFTSTGGEGATGIPKKLWFVPPSHRFTLCFYSVACPTPLQGIFKLKGNTSVELFVQLKLRNGIQNSFDFCDVFIPFYNRGPMLNFEFKSTQGALQASEDKHSLKWNLGTKFSSKSLEVVLTAKVDFCDGPLLTYNDPFCIHKNSYIQVNFQQKNTTLSGCNIDPKSVVVSPAHKTKVHIEQTVHSTEYRIWNTFGDLPYPEIPEDCMPKQFIAGNV